MKILMLDSSTYGEDVNVDKFYGLGEVKSYQTSTRQEALERTAGFNPDVVIICRQGIYRLCTSFKDDSRNSNGL